MTLSYEEFVRQARGLVAESERLGDGWELSRVRVTDSPEETEYLVKKTIRMVNFHDPEAPGEELENPQEAGGPDEFEDHDPAALQSSKDSSKDGSTAVNFDYNIVHSPSYQVPVLYFTATLSTGRQVPLEGVWQLMSPAHATGSGTEWGTVTQLEHPLLCRPFYHIHPCHTADVMGMAVQRHGNETEQELGGREEEEQCSQSATAVTECGEGATSYLLSWLSMYGPTVGLQVPLRYIHGHHFKS